jgi:hypothetical protein
MSQSQFKLYDRVRVTQDGETYYGVIAGVPEGLDKYDVQREGVLSGAGREHNVKAKYIRRAGRPMLVKGAL